VSAGAAVVATTEVDGALAGAASHPSRTARACSLRRHAARTTIEVPNATTRQRIRHAITRADYCMTQLERDPFT
jgi:hypothetical protein